MIDPMTIGLIASGVGALGKGIFGMSQMNKANQLNPQFAEYKENPLARQNLGAAQQLFYGRTPGMSQAQANIQAAQANQLAAGQRGATDAATLLALGAGTQGATNAALSNLAAQEGQQKMGMFDNLSRAYAMSIGEGDKVQQNKMMKFQFDANAQNALRQSGIGNIFGAASDIAGGAMQYGNYQNAQDYNKALMGMNIPKQSIPIPTPSPSGSSILNNFYATRPKINENYIPNSRGITRQNSTFMDNMSNWNKARSLKG
jgi:hypothetical protein